MKLYEFSVIDKYQSTDRDLDRYVALSLEEDALLMGWAPGYIIEKRPTVAQLPDGALEFTYEVFGEYLNSKNEDQERQGALSSSPSPSQNDRVASDPSLRP